MEVIDLIPKGNKNGISRMELRILTGKTDREVRRDIEEARGKKLIVNLGMGYFEPDLCDPVDVNFLHEWIAIENSRANAIIRNIQVASILMGEAGL